MNEHSCRISATGGSHLTVTCTTKYEKHTMENECNICARRGRFRVKIEIHWRWTHERSKSMQRTRHVKVCVARVNKQQQQHVSTSNKPFVTRLQQSPLNVANLIENALNCISIYYVTMQSMYVTLTLWIWF